MPELNAILANTAAFGFVFVDDEVSTDDGKMSLGLAPILVVRDIPLFREHFPGRVEAMLDGSSARVISQRVTRNARIKNSRITAEELRPRVLTAILGVKSRTSHTVTQRVYILPDETTTTDKAVFLAAWNLAPAAAPVADTARSAADQLAAEFDAELAAEEAAKIAL